MHMHRNNLGIPIFLTFTLAYVYSIYALAKADLKHKLIELRTAKSCKFTRNYFFLNIMESTRYPASALGRAIERLKAKKLLETNGYSVTKGKNHKKKFKVRSKLI